MLHTEILSDAQRALLPLLQEWRGGFGLVGGTALALEIGHRESIDFDLFTHEPLRHAELRGQIVRFGQNILTVVDTPTEYTVVVNGVKLTLLHYPFPLEFPVIWDEVAVLPDILTLAAMKAYALGRRAKWKDYVDLYFVLKDRASFADIVQRAESIFRSEFSEKNFRTTLSYFEDIDRSESVIYRPGYETSDAAIEQALTQWSLG